AVTPATITGIAFEGASFDYDGNEHEIAIAGNLPSGVSVAYENNGRTDVGSQPVTAVLSGSNYQPLTLIADLTITPARRELWFPSLPERTYGDPDFEAGAVASTGEAIIYTSDNPQVADIIDGHIRITGAGTATITATVATNDNYANKPQRQQVLTVNRAPQTITINLPAEIPRDAGTVPTHASASSGLPVSLTLDDPQVAILNGMALDIRRLGTVSITATQEGNSNYLAAEPVIVTVRVVDPGSDLPVRVHPAVSPNGDGINEFLMIEAIKDYPNNRVTIFNRNGTVLWEASGYDNDRVAFRGISTGQLLL